MVGAPALAADVAHTYRITLRRSEDEPGSSWLAEVDELPGCSARGATPEEALQRAWSAANEAVGPSEEAADTPAASSARHSGRLLVRMPATLHDELARSAALEGVSLNQLITGTLAAAVRWRAPAAASTAGEDTGRPSDSWFSPRVVRFALVANVVVLVLAALAAIALVVVAWQTG